MDYGGFIHIIDETRRAEDLEWRIERDARFTEAVSHRDWKPKQCEIFLLSFDDRSLSYAALARRIGSAASGKDKIELTNFVYLGNIPFAEVENGISNRLTYHFSRASVGGGRRIPPRTWQATLALLSNRSPHVATGLAELARLRNDYGKTYRGRSYELIEEEKDAATLAIALAGMEKNELSRAFDVSSTSDGSSIFRHVNEARLLEDAIIAHDQNVFGDWVRQSGSAIGATAFAKGNDILIVINANRTTIEHATGVDLVYLHHDWDLFVMVQYKRLRHESRDNDFDESMLCYRPDAQCREEQARMEAFLTRFPDEWSGFPSHTYRLNSNPFYFKLCNSISYDPFSTKLTSGMYIPLDNWRHLLRGGATGPRGASRVTYVNAQPYLTNSMFTSLVTSRLIGCRGLRSEQMREIVAASVDAQRSVVAAEVLPRRSGFVLTPTER